jgi:splicing factor 3A subunit 1
MAPSLTNGDALAALDEIKAPTGVVIPPKEIKGELPFLVRSGIF